MSNLTSDELHHAGRKGMKWGMHIFGRRRTGTGGRFRRDKNPDPKNVKIPKKLRKSVDERMREAEFLDMYRSRDNMSTKALKAKIARLEAERKFKELVEAPEKARREALQKKKQARLAFVGKAASAALDVYSKVPSSVVGNGKSGQAAKDAIEAFKKRQEWAKAFKDVPTTMTKFTQSINVGGVDVYIPESVQNRFMIQHAGRKGMKWGMHIFGDPNRRAFNTAVRGTRRVVKAFDKLQRKGRLFDNNVLAESESINSLMSKGKGSPKYNPSTYNKDVVKTIIRNNGILKGRRMGTDDDSIAISNAASALKYGKGSHVDKVYESTSDNPRGLNKRAKSLFKENRKLQEGHADGKISDKEYKSRSADIQREQRQNAMARGKNPIAYEGTGGSFRDRKIEKIGNLSKTIGLSAMAGYQGGFLSFMANAAGTMAGPSLSLVNPVAVGAGVATGATIAKISNEYENNYRPRKAVKDALLDSGQTRIDKYGVKSAADAIRTHNNTTLKVYDNGPTKIKTIGDFNFSRSRATDASPNSGGLNYTILREDRRKINHSGVNMGEIINGVYIPSQDDLLLHYGKKGMKWKKSRQGMTPAQAAFADAEEREANHDYGKDMEKYKKEASYYQNKVKGGVEKGKARNKKEQKYLDKHEEAMRKYIDASERKDKQKYLRKKVKHSGASDDLLLHYGKKGMKWKKKKAPTPEEEIDQNDAAYHSAKKEIDRLETMLSKYKKGKGKISSVKSVQDQIDKFKESVRAYQDKDDEIRSRTGSKYQSKTPMYSETVDKKTGAKLRKYNRNFKHSDASKDTLLHYGKKGMKWKKKGEGAIGIGTVGAAPAFQDKALERRAIIERLIAKEHDKAAKKTNDPKKKEIRKDLREKAKKNSKELEKKREKMYNPYRGDKLPK